MSWIQNQAFSLILPLILGPVVFAVMQGLKAASSWVDSRPAWQKRVLVPAIALIVTALSSSLGQQVACDPSALNAADCLSKFDADALKAVLASGVAFLLHWLKSRPAK